MCAVAAVVVWLTAASTERLAPLAEGTPPFDATVYSGAAIGGSVALATLAALFVVAVVSTRPRTRPADRAEFSPAGR
ncbi:hypothetical protein DW322_19500 [Rhodococcus rhodnii]|uniref:Uncharacterized protein n=2 Tax=Rhodococcus rhodnii TaxID=38312 RepID=R7WPI3_9NOCA|nr:hypothetical protein Rrhod_1438 [Rhodococcus rhodnii LMG 5362]TXG91963.1 hypothetical protein DW322_19500 [Rhodococcus rhodnii]